MKYPILILSITDRCNLKCSYCFKANETTPKNDLPLQDWKDAYDIFKPKVIQLFGGEPTLRWNDILEFMDYIYKEKPLNPATFCDIDTNGTLNMDFETIPKEYRKYVNISFSLDIFEEINDKYRGKGSYQKTIKNIKKSIKAGLGACINSTISAQCCIDNIDLIPDFIKYLKNIGVMRIKLGIIFEPNTDSTIESVSNDNVLKAVKMLENLKAVKEYDVLVLNKIKYCNKYAFCIQSNGDFSPKCTVPGLSYGNYKKWTLDKALKMIEYCHKIKWDCKNKSHKDIDKFAKGLLMT